MFFSFTLFKLIQLQYFTFSSYFTCLRFVIYEVVENPKVCTINQRQNKNEIKKKKDMNIKRFEVEQSKQQRNEGFFFI